MSWIEVPSDAPASGEQLASLMSERVQRHLTEGHYKQGDIDFVREVSFLPVKGRLEVSDQLLERLRRLCQLWEVDLLAPRQLSSHRKFIGPLIVAAKRLCFPILKIFLKDTLRRQRDFNAQVIVTLAELAARPGKPRGE
jgi:hypothetical protein